MLLKKSGVYLVATIAASVAGGSVTFAESPTHKSWNMIAGEKRGGVDAKSFLHNIQQQSVQLKFENRYPQPVDYYMVNPVTNQPQFLDTIGPGQSIIVQGTPGMRWVFGQNQNQIQAYDTQIAPLQQVIISPQGQQGPQQQPGGAFQPGVAQGPGVQPTGGFQPPSRNGGVVPPVPRGGQQAQPGQQAPQTRQPFQPRGGQQTQQQPQQPSRPQTFEPGKFNPNNPPRQPQTAQPLQPAQPQQRGAGIPRLQTQQQTRLPQPPMLYEIGITLDTCRKARFSAGAPQIQICQYLGQLWNLDPAAYQNYLNQVDSIRQTRSIIENQQGGGAHSDSGSAVGSGEVASWGGVVRSGPGMENNRVDSLQKGEAIELLQDSGVHMNGYNWYQIRYRGNQIGYQWGGIICGRYQPVPGVHEVCN